MSYWSAAGGQGPSTGAYGSNPGIVAGGSTGTGTVGSGAGAGSGAATGGAVGGLGGLLYRS